ncbi:huntingtin-interacting protein 1-related protein isoform X1 [Pseudorca crassidens]|uniref:huntingtin-interacting protein 1-related protein isoform X1 n=1 Tax=Pseudorca crassidens TaxID=82174 RepID=UPI00352C0C94
MNPSASFLAGRQNIGSEVEISTIEKQRRELQLLIGELKDRDRELNDMVAVHQRQLLSWEEDRQKVLTLEERCSKLEGELHKRTEIIRSLTKKVKTLESNQIEYQSTLQKTQLQLQEMAQKATHSTLLSEDLEVRNENLSNTLVELSAQVGQLQAREQALTTMIKLKDKDIIEAVNHIADCSGKFKLLEHALRDAKMVETCIVKEKQDYKQKLKALKIEVNKLKVERDKRKDELLDIAKSKQERMSAELHNLRQIYIKQQRDLQFLNFNVESSQELIQIYDSKVEESKALESSREMCLSDLENNHLKVDFKREENQKSLVKDQKFETTLVQQNKSEESSYDVCKEKKLQVNTSFGGKSVIAISSLLAKDLVEKQKSWSPGGKIQTEPENKSTFCKIHARSPKGNGGGIQNEEKQRSETSTSVADEKWHDISLYLGLANCSGSKQPEKLDVKCQDHLERSGVSCCHKSEACLDESDMWESKCCHPSNFIIEAPGHLSDVEWMSIFKPSRVQRIVRHKSVCTCSESASGTKYNSSTSELIASQQSHCLGSSKSALREDEKLIEMESSSDKKNSSKILLVNKDAALPSEKDDFSPTSKLQRLLAESRQMVTDLERSTLLPISSENLSSTAKNAISISKAINTQEAPVKEKHARRIILGTHHEKGAFTFWSYAIGLPLPSSSILSWKFCHVLHKVLRDGHPNVLHDCQRYRSNIREIGDLWGHLHDRYGQLVNIYTKLLLTKISFHLKHPEFPAGLEVTDEVLEKAAGTDVNNVFQLTVEMFDYMDCALKLSESVFRQLNTAIAVSQMSSGQCRLAPLIQVIQDCSPLYHYTVKLMFKLHSCLPADTLQGHRDRFHEQFHSLRNFFRRASDMLYFKRLIQIPRLPEGPPNFLRASALAEHIKPVVVIPEEAPEDEEPENLIEIGSGPPAAEPAVVADLFEQTFGPPNGSMKDDRDLQIETLKREVETLRTELDKIQLEAQRYMAQLKGQVNALEAELEEQRKQKQKALVDNEQLRHEVARLRAAQLEGERHQGLREEAEKKASATEARYNKLKEKHSELITTHAELLRKNADTAKQLTVTQQSQEEVARVKEQLAFQVEQVKRESEMKLEEQSDQLEKLKRELEAKAGELVRAQAALSHAEQSGLELSSRLDTLSAEKDTLSSEVRQRQAELVAAQSLVREKEAALDQEQQRSSRERGELQGRLADKESQEQGLQRRLLDEQFAMLRGTAAEAERILQDAVGKLDDPLHLRCTSSPDYLVSRAQAALDAVSTLEKGHAQYLISRADASALVAALTRFSHLAADTIVHGSATSHLAPTDPADRLIDTCRECGVRALELVRQLQDQQALLQAQPSLVQTPLQGILQLGQELKPKILDVRQEELGAVVDKEMAATSAAIEDAVRRIEDVMNQARHASSGVKLEVNERILNSCTDLMKAIRLLVTTSTSLQKEIVESGRGAATQQEFYAKNSRWTEGLISASKAVGWGATQLVESADRVVLHTGKYEELIVCSHEIAASTAQLVAASKVKADKHSPHLSRLQECSRAVNEMAASVVASTRSGQEQIEDRDTMDFSGLSLIKLKKQEMETQVRVLELEKTLEVERVRLGELRKQHYMLAGAVGTPGADEPGRPSAAPRGGTSKKPPLAQKPSVAPRQDQQLDKKDGSYAAPLVNY